MTGCNRRVEAPPNQGQIVIQRQRRCPLLTLQQIGVVLGNLDEMAEPIPRRFVANACNLEFDDAVRCVPIEHTNLATRHSTLKLHTRDKEDAPTLVWRVAATLDDVRCP